jgi:hypothetical protein
MNPNKQTNKQKSGPFEVEQKQDRLHPRGATLRIGHEKHIRRNGNERASQPIDACTGTPLHHMFVFVA